MRGADRSRVLGLGQREPAGRVRGDRHRLGGGPARLGDQRASAILAGVMASPGERGQLGLRAQAFGAQPDADLRGLVRAHPRKTVVRDTLGVAPSALPQGELAGVRVGDGCLGVLVDGRPRLIQVLPRGAEVAATGLEGGAVDQRVARVVARHRPQRRGADHRRFVPLADSDQCLEPVGDERCAVDPGALQLLERAGRHVCRRARPPQHR